MPGDIIYSQRRAGVSPASNGGQDARPPLVNVSAEIRKHEHRLPHWQQGNATQFVTWRLADSLPREKLDLWKHEKDSWMRAHPKPWDGRAEKEYHRNFGDRLDDWLDAGTGSCMLRDSDNRRIVEDALRHFDGQRYNLCAFVIMPNHVHALFSLRPPHLLEQALHSWKSFTAKEINRRLGKRGTVWQEDYWDRLVRSEEHYHAYLRYIRKNPEKARLSAAEYTLFVREGSAGVPPVADGAQDGR